MDDLWKVVGELAATLHSDRITSIADAIAHLKSVDEFDRARPAFGPNADIERIERLRVSWASALGVSSSEIAAAFRGAAEVAGLLDGGGAIELVWTGPKTGLIPTRHTEQVMLEVIGSSKSDVFLVTYVFHRAASIIKALDAAVARGVDVRILLESSTEEGGAVKGDGLKAMHDSVPGAMLYVWNPASKKQGGDALSASVHAKCVVADRNMAFITSANLTSAAMERNMEIGLLIRGGTVPDRLRAHLDALCITKVLIPWDR